MKIEKIVAIVFVGLVISFFTGCYGPKAEMAMNLAPQSETVYKVVTVFGKDYSFTQPALGKEVIKNTRNTMEITFAQNVTSVKGNGSAAADITIKALSVLVVDPKGITMDFDSSRDADKKNPLSNLIGKSYKIEMSKNGAVLVKDLSKVSGVVKSGIEKRFADRLFSKDEVQKRHQVMALMSAKQGAYAEGDSWSELTASPAGMLTPKTYEKVYTVEKMKKQGDDQIVVVKMNALPSSKRIDGAPAEQSQMGMMAGMFDEQDSYTGNMELNLTTGEIEKYDETVKVEWVAMEQTGEKSDKGPDQLMMGFTRIYSIEKVK